MIVILGHLDNSRSMVLRSVDDTNLVLQFVGGQRFELPPGSPN